MAFQRTRETVVTEERDLRPAATTDVVAEETHTVATDPYDAKRDSAWRVGQFVGLIFGAVVALTAIRFVMLLLGANPDAWFVSFIYSVTGPLVAPFEGIFGAPDVETGVFDPASLVAIPVYAVVGWGIGKLIDIMLGDSRTGVRSSTRSIDTHVR